MTGSRTQTMPEVRGIPGIVRVQYSYSSVLKNVFEKLYFNLWRIIVGGRDKAAFSNFSCEAWTLPK